MHSFHWKDAAYNEDGQRPAREVTQVNIHYNGDYSGNVAINVPTRVGMPAVHNYSVSASQARDEGIEPGDYHIAELRIPFAALLAFIEDCHASKAVAMMEDADDTAMAYFALGQALARKES